MKKLIAVMLALALLPCALGEAPSPAETLMSRLDSGEFETVYAECSPDMRSALKSADALSTLWAQLTGTFGEYISSSVSETAEQGGFTAHVTVCDFALAEVSLVISFDENGLLAGLFVQSYEMKTADAPVSGIIEEEITLRAGARDETRGMLTLPEGEGPFPCVIMMQGSGPSDMDENIGGTPIFKQLARGLALMGVASVRYDKYTYAHAELIDTESFGIEGEYLIDAKAALELIESDARVGDIFLLGHSLGACIAPRAFEYLGAERISGCVMLAGTPESLFALMLRQLKDGGMSDTELDEMQSSYDSLAGMSEAERAGVTIYGAPGAYYLDEASVDEAALILKYSIPVFIAQGDNDVQVTPAEGVEAWKTELGAYDGAEYAVYEGMPHALTDGAEVSQALIDDIAAWVLAR